MLARANSEQMGRPEAGLRDQPSAEYLQRVLAPPLATSCANIQHELMCAPSWHHAGFRVLDGCLGSATLRAAMSTPRGVAVACSPTLSGRTGALLGPSLISQNQPPTSIRLRRSPLPGLWTCGRVLRTGPSPTGRVDKSWSTPVLTTTCPHSRASRPQGPQATNNKLFRHYVAVAHSFRINRL